MTYTDFYVGFKSIAVLLFFGAMDSTVYVLVGFATLTFEPINQSSEHTCAVFIMVSLVHGEQISFSVCS